VEEKKREVYINKSYNYKSYNCNNNSIWDPSNKQNVVMEKAKYKGCHYCFVVAILRPNPRVFESNTIGNRARLVLGII
jgi:hypothetical protein